MDALCDGGREVDPVHDQAGGQGVVFDHWGDCPGRGVQRRQKARITTWSPRGGGRIAGGRDTSERVERGPVHLPPGQLCQGPQSQVSTRQEANLVMETLLDND